MRACITASLAATLLLVGVRAHAELPDIDTLLSDLGFGSSAIQDIRDGHISSGAAKPGSERELAAGFAFRVGMAPKDLIEQLKGGLLAETDPNTISLGTISGEGRLQDFAKLSLGSKADARVAAYLNAKPGGRAEPFDRRDRVRSRI